MSARCVFLLINLIVLDNLKPSTGFHNNNKRNLLYFPKFNYNIPPKSVNSPFFSLKQNSDINKPFVDLTKTGFLHSKPGLTDKKLSLSDDYIDFTDFVRDERSVPVNGLDMNKRKPMFLNPNDPIRIEDFISSLIVGRRSVPIQKSRGLSSESDSSGSDKSDDNSNKDYSDMEDSSLEDMPGQESPKIFEVINSEASQESNDAEDLTRSENTEKYIYMQAPTRFVDKHGENLRRRLKHFLPKRVHWSEADFQNLRSYWIKGPRGQYPEQYKTPY